MLRSLVLLGSIRTHELQNVTHVLIEIAADQPHPNPIPEGEGKRMNEILPSPRLVRPWAETPLRFAQNDPTNNASGRQGTGTK